MRAVDSIANRRLECRTVAVAESMMADPPVLTPRRYPDKNRAATNRIRGNTIWRKDCNLLGCDDVAGVCIPTSMSEVTGKELKSGEFDAKCVHGVLHLPLLLFTISSGVLSTKSPPADPRRKDTRENTSTRIEPHEDTQEDEPFDATIACRTEQESGGNKNRAWLQGRMRLRLQDQRKTPRGPDRRTMYKNMCQKRPDLPSNLQITFSVPTARCVHDYRCTGYTGATEAMPCTSILFLADRPASRWRRDQS